MTAQDIQVPIIIQGESGTGKSTLLRMLAIRLSSSQFVPVEINISGLREVNLLKLVADKFRGATDVHLRRSDESDALWRYLIRAARIVCIVDGLDEFGLGMDAVELENDLAEACRLACESGVLLVAAARTWSVGSKLGYFSSFHLEPLDLDECAEFLNKVGERQYVSSELAAWLQPELRTPFYLNLISRISGDETALSTAWPVPIQGQVALMNEFLRWALVDSSNYFVDSESVKDGISKFSAALTLQGRSEGSVGSTEPLPGDTVGSDLKVEEGIRIGLKVGLLHRVGTSAALRFRHGLIEDYFSSRYYRTNFQNWLVLADRVRLSHQFRVLIMSGIADDGQVDGQFVEAVSGQLMKLIMESIQPSKILGLAMCWLTWHTASVSQERWWNIAKRLVETRQTLSQADKKALIELLKLSPSDEALWVLWTYTQDPNFPVRWNAAIALASSGDRTYRVLGNKFSKILTSTANELHRGQIVKDYLSAGVLAWLLPSLADQVSPNDQEKVQEMLASMRALASMAPDPLWLEQSLARGYKIASKIEPRLAVSESLLDILQERPRFWYARINLIHAISYRLLQNPNQVNALHALEVASKSDQHPFVSEAARLALAAVQGRLSETQALWLVESEVLEKDYFDLAGETLVLVGDLVLLLNLIFCKMNDSATERAGSELAKLWSTSDRLPECIRSTSHRSALFRECSGKCEFRLCPYPVSESRGSARGEFTPAFCRRLRNAIAIWGGGSWDKGSQRHLSAFWKSMESVSISPRLGDNS
ncbi:MAG: ATP-binding protein [Acidimicrobiaceae bacterium]|nr:ATP-binding protein [Acidimicrobiaceae bacterium]